MSLKGRVFFKENEAPNFFKGSATLLKSLLDKLLSPIILIGKGVSIKIPEINLPSVPEFPAFIVMFFLRGMIVYQLLIIENNKREVIIVNPTDNPNKILVNKYWYRTLQLCSILSCLSSINYIYFILYRYCLQDLNI